MTNAAIVADSSPLISGFSVNAYVEKCKSCLYAENSDRQPLIHSWFPMFVS